MDEVGAQVRKTEVNLCTFSGDRWMCIPHILNMCVLLLPVRLYLRYLGKILQALSISLNEFKMNDAIEWNRANALSLPS